MDYFFMDGSARPLDSPGNVVIHSPAMFGGILILIVTTLHAYVFWRASSVPFLKRHIGDRTLTGLCIALWFAFFLGRVYGHDGTGPLARHVETVGMTWMAILFLLSVSLMATEVVTGFGFFMPRIAPKMRGFALVTGMALAVIAQIQGMRPPQISSYEVYLNDLPEALDGTVLLAMSDLHVGSQRDSAWLRERIAQVRGEHPDMVVLLGDLFEGHGAPDSGLLPALKGLTAPLGVWAVPGNHEFHRGGGDGLALIEQAGIHVLFNRWVEARPGLILAGIEDLTSIRRSGRGDDPLPEALAGRPRGATILLSHTPWEYEEAAGLGVDLMLSGHTHGGQIWPFGLVVRLSYPLLAGRYEVKGMTVIVCRGTGTWATRMRLWQPGEILRVTLHSAGQG